MRFALAPRLCCVLVVALMLLALAPGGRAAEADDLRAATARVRAGDYAGALALAGPAGSLASDVVEWHRLRDARGAGTLAEYRAFLARRPDWPGLPYLMQIGERAIGADADPRAVLAYFDLEPPQTGAGLLAAVRADLAVGETGDAEALAVLAWRSMDLSAAQEDVLLRQFPKLLAGQAEARLDMALWRGIRSTAERMLPRVSEGWRALAEARMALRASADGVDALIARVPAALADDPGLAWERFQWRKRKGLTDAAIALAIAQSTSAEALGQPARWSRDRYVLARGLMREGKAETAYRLASRHFLVPEDTDYASLEWLSGYLALRFLGQPQTALEHFTRFRGAVSTPISLGRAGYWEGRALEAMGATHDAQAAYEFGAEFQTSFYGLLAAEKAGVPMDPALLGRETFPDAARASFAQTSTFQAAMLLFKAGEADLGKRFLRHLAESLDAGGIGQLADVALDLGAPDAALRLAKYAADQGIVLNRAYYPMAAIATGDWPVPPEIALAIARRESEFDPAVVSPAGARGLMQLMPATAEAMAKAVGVDYELARLTTDPAYNARLGTAYLAKLVEEFGANWMLVAAGYNAGPGRPRRWIVDYGDPREAGVDPVDWIETIPFEETRNYVMRVTEAIAVYRARLAGKVGPITLSEDLKAR